MSKVVTMVALLRELDWGDRAGEAMNPELKAALGGAITRSENCRERRVVLELQERAGSLGAARAAVAKVLQMAGGGGHVTRQVDIPDALCVPYLQSQVDLDHPLAPALLLGTSTWRVGDAVRFLNALAAGVYGRAVAHRVLGLMRRPKRPSREGPRSDYTAPLDWGAGTVLARLHPAYKAGWGGSIQHAFLAGQIVSIRLRDGRTLSLAVMFHPDTQPTIDDPGLTKAPKAVETVMHSVATLLRHEQSSRSNH